jgi:hypothetical protein
LSFDMERAQKLLDAVNSGAVKSSELRPDDATLLNNYLDTKIAERKPLAPAAPKPTEQRGGLLGFFDRLRAKNTEVVAKQAEMLGGKLDLSAENYGKVPEVARGLAKGIASMPPVSLLMPKDEKAKLGEMTTPAGKAAEAIGGFAGGIPLDVALSPIGGRAAAKVGTALTNPLARAAVKGAVRGATEVGLTEVVKQGVDAVRGENVTPASAAKQIGGAVLGGGIFGGALGAGGELLASKLKPRLTPQANVADDIAEVEVAATPKPVATEDDAADFILSRVSTDKPSKTMPTLERLYSRFVDRLQPIKRATATLADDALPESQNPFSLARVAKGWAGKADSMLTAGVFDNAGTKVADSLQDVLKPVADDLPKFRAYAVERRAIEIAERGMTPYKDFVMEDAAARLKLLETPTRKKAFDSLLDFQSAVIDETMLRSGMMSQDAVNAMRELNKQHVPFHRVFDAAEMGQKGVADTFANIGQVVKKLQGSERDIVDPLESVIKNTYALTSAAERNKVGAALATLVEKNADLASPWMQKVDDVTNAAKEGVVSIWRNGQRELYKVDPDLYASLTHLDKESSNILVKILAPPASWLRAGATLTPEFIGRNPIRDQWTAFLNSKYGYTPFVDLGRGIAESIKKGSLYDEFQRSGAAQSSLVSLDRAYLQKSLGDVLGGGSVWDKAKRLASNPLDVLRGLSELMEEGTRLGAFKKAKDAALKSGVNYEDALIKAAQEAREITLDFGRRGSQTGALNRTIAFFNATLQGTDKMVRAIKENPAGYLSKAAASITLPSLALWYMNKDDPRYKELPQWQKDLFWIVLTKDHIYRIPKPFEAGVIFGTSFERMAQWMTEKDPQAFDGLGKTLQEGFTPSFLFTALVPWESVRSNKSLFTGAPIVPQRELKLPKVRQYGPYTTETAKGIANILDKQPFEGLKLGPRQVEEYVQGYGGGLGKLGLQTGDALLSALGQGSKIPKPATDWTSLPGIRGFTVQPYQQSQSVNDFYELLNKLQTQKAGMDAGGERMQQKDIGALMRLLEANKTMSEFNKQEREIQMSTKLTPEQKRQRLDALNKRQADLARKALKR